MGAENGRKWIHEISFKNSFHQDNEDIYRQFEKSVFGFYFPTFQRKRLIIELLDCSFFHDNTDFSRIKDHLYKHWKISDDQRQVFIDTYSSNPFSDVVAKFADARMSPENRKRVAYGLIEKLSRPTTNSKIDIEEYNNLMININYDWPGDDRKFFTFTS